MDSKFSAEEKRKYMFKKHIKDHLLEYICDFIGPIFFAWLLIHFVLKENEYIYGITFAAVYSAGRLIVHFNNVYDNIIRKKDKNEDKAEQKSDYESKTNDSNKNTELSEAYKSIIEQDKCAIVICSPQHEIVYMNPAAIKNYSKRGGDKLIGESILNCHNEASGEKIKQVVEWFLTSPNHNIVYTFYNEKQNKDVYMVALRSEGKLIGYYEKHEFRNRETMKLYDLKSARILQK